MGDDFNRRLAVLSAWGEFLGAWGWDVAPDGAPGDTTVDEAEFCTTVCQRATQGSGVAQFSEPRGVGIDSEGDIYVHDIGSDRVQKFNDEGEFLLMFGGQVNKTKVALRESQEANSEPVTVVPAEENRCTAEQVANGDQCGAGIAGSADGYFDHGSFNNLATQLAVNRQTNSIFVGGIEGVQEFSTDGVFIKKLPIPSNEVNPDSQEVGSLAADPVSGDLYFGYWRGLAAQNRTPNVYRLDPDDGTQRGILPAVQPRAIAVGLDGNVYVATDSSDPSEPPEIVGFNSEGEPLEGMQQGDRFGRTENVGVAMYGLAANICPGSEQPGNLYATVIRAGPEVSRVVAYGSGPVGCEPPPPAPPKILAQYATQVNADGAVVKADIDPVFWSDTAYQVEYGAEPCSGGGCQRRPGGSGLQLTTRAVRQAVATRGISLANLQPDTTYYYRFVAISSGSGGEEVIGEGGVPGTPGTEGSFRTVAPTLPGQVSCPNQVFRIGLGARLPECRAYEMVTPVDKNNGDIITSSTPSSGDFPARYNQGANSGDALTYSALTAFGGADASPYVSQYITRRKALGSTDAGWSSEPISPPRTRPLSEIRSLPLDTEYQAFSSDLCRGWFRMLFDPPLAQGAVAGVANLYQRTLCGQDGFLGVTPSAPPVGERFPDFNYLYSGALHLQGMSEDGAAVFYTAPDDLPGTGATANTTQKTQLYEYFNGSVRFACILPSGNPSNQNCFLGTKGPADGRGSSHDNAVSANGSQFYWTESADKNGPGRLLLGRRGQVSIAVNNNSSRFWGASVNGDRAIYETGGQLFSFNATKAIAGEGGASTLIASGLGVTIGGVMGVSDDGMSVYFATADAIAGSGPNSEGDMPQADKSNLYLWREGEGVSFIATLAGSDVNGRLSSISTSPVSRTSRVSPDGGHAVFTSAASITGYDNLDVNSRLPDTEVFIFDADTETVRCVSCNPSGARPVGEVFEVSGGSKPVWVAATIPPWESPLYGSRPLSDSGDRLFFESLEALVPRDINEVRDVYLWQRASSRNACVESGAHSYVEAAGGCLSLISTGDSPRGSFFIDADPTGRDIFFATESSLVTTDYGLVDIYDARVEGGFPAPVVLDECEGDTCQGPPSPPADITPASAVATGPGNLKSSSAKPKKCPKGKVRKGKKGKAAKVCVKKKKANRKKKARRAGKQGGGGR